MKTLLLVLLLAAPAEPARWIEVASDPYGRFLLDRESLSRRGDRVTFLLSFIAYAPRPDGVAEELSQMRIDCRRRTLLVRSVLLRREAVEGASGTSVAVDSEIRPAHRRAAPIKSGSLQEAVMIRVCGRTGH